jgi:adenylate cyclase
MFRRRQELAPGIPRMAPGWEKILRGESSLAVAQRVYRRMFALMPSPWRCKFCNAPFSGPYAGKIKWLGFSPSAKNPHICARCVEWAPKGGAVVPLSVLFADVRGYTRMTEGLSAEEVPALMNRFYETASSALLAHEALLGQVEGDNVMALFVPGLAGKEYRKQSVEAGRKLLGAVGPRSELGLDIGVGIASGEEFVGNVGGGGYKDFTALGDVTNTSARLTAKAESGEILIDSQTYDAVADTYPDAERRSLELKGKQAVVETYVILAAAED